MSLNDAEAKKQKKRILQLERIWLSLLSLDHYLIRNEWNRGAIPDFPDSKDNITAATTVCMWEYEEATIRWNLSAVADLDDDRLEFITVHELMHVLLAPLHAKRPRDIEELVCTRVAKAFIETRESKTATVKERESSTVS